LNVWQLIVLTAAPAFVISLAGGALVRRLALKIGFVDHPNERKLHAEPMPLGGGIAILLGVLLPILVGVAAVVWQWPIVPDWMYQHIEGVLSRRPKLLGVLLGAAALHVLGLADDARQLSAWLKLLAQFAVAAVVVIGFDVRLNFFIPILPVTWAVTILWLVVITNAFNFLDNADGLSAGVALICASVCLAVAAAGGQVFVTAFWAVLAGSLVGFLVHNFPPARLFMGDGGSLPVGWLLGVGTVLTTYYYQTDPADQPIAAMAPLIIMAVPLYDFVSVLYLRHRSGQRLMAGDRRHFSHRLLRRGFTVRSMVLTIYLATACTACGAIVLQAVHLPYAVLVFVQTGCIVAIIAILEHWEGHGLRPAD